MTVLINMTSLFRKETTQVTKRVSAKEYNALVTMHGKKNVTIITSYRGA